MYLKSVDEKFFLKMAVKLEMSVCCQFCAVKLVDMLNLSRAYFAARRFCFKLMSFWLTKKINLKHFNQAQIAGWSEVARDLAQVLFAALVIEGLSQDKVFIVKVLLGAFGAAILWFTSHKLNAKLKS